ncbi:hypothetical protein [Caulobacter mirabilis]|uniref:Uncharacterized protein n=1 Tax=Caulobacter mirabilis TaxID=69666 RepID=A0A2D2AWG3_9CAUL|nr:hypothetical protein [Caulobacter mirabilis]ATQ42333.1 hypothetical protein CSW64_07850 [Caulobacter mirabilis]
MRAILLAALIFLGGCGGPKLSDRQRDEVSDIASAEAHDAMSDSSKVSELEGRIDDLEARLEELESREPAQGY